MVFVQINYRVGAFGFLASEDIREDGDLNVGLLDQRLSVIQSTLVGEDEKLRVDHSALEWVQKYIHLVC